MELERAKEIAQMKANDLKKPVVVFDYEEGGFGQTLLEYWEDPTKMQEFPHYYDGCEWIDTILPELNKMTIAELLAAWTELEGHYCCCLSLPPVGLPYPLSFYYRIGTFTVRVRKETIEPDELGKLYLAVVEAIAHKGWQYTQHNHPERDIESRYEAHVFYPEWKNPLVDVVSNKSPVVALLMAYIDCLRHDKHAYLAGS